MNNEISNPIVNNTFNKYATVMLKDNFKGDYGKGVLGDGNEQTDMATVISMEDLKEYSKFINPQTGNKNNVIVEYGSEFSIYPANALKIFEGNTNDPMNGGRRKRMTKKKRGTKKYKKVKNKK
jgi:hypothetical protein